MKEKSNIENVFGQLSNIDNVDQMLRDEGLVPEKVVKNGMEKLRAIQSTEVSKKRIIDLIKIKMNKSITKEALKAMNSLTELIPSMNVQQVDMVFRSLNDSSENSTNLDFLIKTLKSDSELQKIMKKNNSEENN